jgi:hypothetical protein
MSASELNRRDFHRLSMAAMGGVMAGAIVGCEGNNAPAPAPTTTPPAASTTPAAKGTEVASTAGEAGKTEPHLCRGLNACKGQGGGESAGKNACAGQGECATVKEHTCGGENECKGLGGCGENPALNECKGKGGCHIPLMDSAWKKVRQRFEEKMKTAGKEVGPAPAKKAG